MNKAQQSMVEERDFESIEQRIEKLLMQMTRDEKIGQLQQVDATGDVVRDDLKEAIIEGRIGSVINQTNLSVVHEIQRLAVEESRLGIPLLIARDVIHGFSTVMPIPLGQAASWNIDLVREGARLSAVEASAHGINWTFAPMIDISRDPRWGRIAESLGEDPYLTGVLGVAMVEGFQGPDLTAPSAIAACAKHFAGYGASESGRDYNTTNIPENELRNVYLPPFRDVAEAGVATFMSSFSDIDGIPATANEFLMRQVLREEWSFDGLVVSDWNAITQLSVHGLTANDREAAFEAVCAGIDMEMAGNAYADYLGELIDSSHISIERIDEMVANVLRAKFRLGLFDDPFPESHINTSDDFDTAFQIARDLARESIVLLKNDNHVLPLNADDFSSIAIIGPMADQPQEQLGTWVFDGDPALSVTPLQAVRDFVGEDVQVNFAEAMASTRTRSRDGFQAAIDAVHASDIAILFLGEEAILSGEAHSRADINLPGNQRELIEEVVACGKPVVLVIMAGRPLTLMDAVDDVQALLYAWHPGTMAGPAIWDIIFGADSPSGKLPVTFPKMVGQIPLYYNKKNTGRPPESDVIVHIDDIEIGARQTSLGMTAFHLDAGYEPHFPFGFGLSYAEFSYEKLMLSSPELRAGDVLKIEVSVKNTASRAGSEVVQLYIRDLVGSVTRPVKELKGFRKLHFLAGEEKRVQFELRAEDLAFFRRNKTFGYEAGAFECWVGGSSADGLKSQFTLLTD